MASRYAAVFPLSELINWIFHTRGQRHEELPHSYQMMLFWAGLRGAVGVALAAGITGDNADALRTTVLVVVVLTVILFGGTTARMLEVLGIRMGVEDEDDSEDEDPYLGMQMGRRQLGMRTGRYADDLDDFATSPTDSPYGNALQLGARDSSLRLHSKRPLAGPYRQNSRGAYSTQSSSDSEADEPLPSSHNDIESRGITAVDAEDREGMVFKDGQWFTSLDERYLLPLFSNSVASRRHNQRKAIKRANSLYGEESGPSSPRQPNMDSYHSDYEGNDADSESGKGKGGLTAAQRNFSGSVTDFFFARPDNQGGGQTSGSTTPTGDAPYPPQRNRSRGDLRPLTVANAASSHNSSRRASTPTITRANDILDQEGTSAQGWRDDVKGSGGDDVGKR